MLPPYGEDVSASVSHVVSQSQTNRKLFCKIRKIEIKKRTSVSTDCEIRGRRYCDPSCLLVRSFVAVSVMRSFVSSHASGHRLRIILQQQKYSAGTLVTGDISCMELFTGVP